MSKIKVMLIDDDYYVRQALEMLIRRDPKTTITGSVEQPEEVVDKLASFKTNQYPDLILLDLKFENSPLSGIDVILKIREVNQEVKILVTSMVQNEAEIIEAISRGADGFVWKNESGEGIVSAIAKVHEGRFVITKSVAEKIMGKTKELSEYSIDILPEAKNYQNLTEGLRKTMYLYCFCGMSAKEIAQELNLSAHTVNSRIKAAYIVLQATNRTEAFQQLVERFKE
ncbi:MAG: DNA-binding response regulator [Actinobacteria bacterium]|nr:MAG: DNA-binding response regulator [Actinomycetota bacterium]